MAYYHGIKVENLESNQIDKTLRRFLQHKTVGHADNTKRPLTAEEIKKVWKDQGWTNSKMFQEIYKLAGDDTDFIIIVRAANEIELEDLTRAHVLIGFLIWIIPVVGVYLLGIAIRWVTKGFKQS